MAWERDMIKEHCTAWKNYVKLRLGFVNNGAQPELFSFQTKSIIIIITIIILEFWLSYSVTQALKKEAKLITEITEIIIQENLCIFAYKELAGY